MIKNLNGSRSIGDAEYTVYILLVVLDKLSRCINKYGYPNVRLAIDNYDGTVYIKKV